MINPPTPECREEFEAFKSWAKDNLGQGYSLDLDDHVFIDPVTRWAFAGFRAGLRSRPVAAIDTGWISVEQKPANGRTVLAAYQNRSGRWRRVRAMWVAAKTVESDGDTDSEIAQYDEATDTYYDPEGWYELIDNWDEYSSVFITEGEPVYWRELPPAPLPSGATRETTQ